MEFEPDRMKAQIAWAAEHFFDMQARAEKALQKGDLLSAVVWTQIASDFAFHRHPGFYASPALESLLLEVARKQEETSIGGKTPSLPAAPMEKGAKPRILHVVTQAYWTGGHTRLLARLIANTGDRFVHNLVSTNQKKPLPDWLLSGVKASGGWYTSLTAATPHLLKRASCLRSLSLGWADCVFLHTHPYDALPPLAFGCDGGPPVVLVNHADHVFWLGASVADVVADYRLAGQAITLKRRGARVSKILPIPLSEPDTGMPKALAREKLGIDKDSVVLLTIATPYKYTPFGGYDFIETLTKIVARNKRAILLAVGPAAEGRWLEASRRTDGRIRALGMQSDLRVFHSCADVYLDSFPFGSFTAWPEAGIRGEPVLGLTNLQVPMYTNLDVVPDKSITHADSLDEYISRLDRLIADPEFRRVKGAECRMDLGSRHLLPGWNDYLHKIMLGLPDRHSVAGKLEVSTALETYDLYLAGFNALYDAHSTRNSSLRGHGRHFPFAARCSIYLQSLVGKGDHGKLQFKFCTGLYPKFLLKRIASSFTRNGKHGDIRLSRLLRNKS